jgi:hypothetical protein
MIVTVTESSFYFGFCTELNSPHLAFAIPSKQETSTLPSPLCTITLYAKLMQLHSTFERLCFLLTLSLFRAH